MPYDRESFADGREQGRRDCDAEIKRLRADKAWLSDRLHDAVNTCYGGVTHDDIDACSYKREGQAGGSS